MSALEVKYFSTIRERESEINQFLSSTKSDKLKLATIYNQNVHKVDKDSNYLLCAVAKTITVKLQNEKEDKKENVPILSIVVDGVTKDEFYFNVGVELIKASSVKAIEFPIDNNASEEVLKQISDSSIEMDTDEIVYVNPYLYGKENYSMDPFIVLQFNEIVTKYGIELYSYTLLSWFGLVPNSPKKIFTNSCMLKYQETIQVFSSKKLYPIFWLQYGGNKDRFEKFYEEYKKIIDNSSSTTDSFDFDKKYLDLVKDSNSELYVKVKPEKNYDIDDEKEFVLFNFIKYEDQDLENLSIENMKTKIESGSLNVIQDRIVVGDEGAVVKPSTSTSDNKPTTDTTDKKTGTNQIEDDNTKKLIEKYEQEQNRLNDEIDKLNNQLSDVFNNNNQLSEQLVKLTQSNEENIKIAQDLRDQIIEKEKEKEKLKDENDEKLIEINKLQQEIIDLKKKLNDPSSSTTTGSTDPNMDPIALFKRTQELTKELNDLKDELDKKNRSINDLELQILGLKTNINNLQDENNQLKDEITKLQGNSKGSSDEIDRLKKQIDSKNQEIEDYKIEYNNIYNQNTDLRNNYNDLQTRYDSLLKNYFDVLKRNDSIEKELKKLKENYKETGPLEFPLYIKNLLDVLGEKNIIHALLMNQKQISIDSIEDSPLWYFVKTSDSKGKLLENIDELINKIQTITIEQKLKTKMIDLLREYKLKISNEY